MRARPDADVELCDLAENGEEDDDCTDLRNQQPGPPTRIRDVLEAPGHAHQAQGVERHEGEIETDQPEPKAGLAQPLVEGEAERLWQPGTRCCAERNRPAESPAERRSDRR